MTTRKITLMLPEQLIDVARAAVAGGRAPSVSAYVAAAAAAGQSRLGLEEAVARWTAQAGGSTGQHTGHAEQWARDFIAARDAATEPQPGADRGGASA